MNCTYKTRKLRSLLAGICAVSVLMMSGCTYGIADTLALVQATEEAKQSIENMKNSADDSRVVGSVSDPAAQELPKKQTAEEADLAVLSFDLSYADGTFQANWMVASANQIQIQIFAVADNGARTKIASLSDQDSTGSVSFDNAALAGGTYGYTVTVKDAHGNSGEYVGTVSFVVPGGAEEETASANNGDITTAEVANSEMVGNILFGISSNTIHVSWDDAGAENYCVALLDDETGDALFQRIVSETEIEFDIPAEATVADLIVATYDGENVGAFNPIKIEF